MDSRAEHIKKLTQAEASEDWLLTGNPLEIWAWRPLLQKKKDGSFSKRIKWEVDVTSFSVDPGGGVVAEQVKGGE